MPGCSHELHAGSSLQMSPITKYIANTKETEMYTKIYKNVKPKSNTHLNLYKGIQTIYKYNF